MFRPLLKCAKHGRQVRDLLHTSAIKLESAAPTNAAAKQLALDNKQDELKLDNVNTGKTTIPSLYESHQLEGLDDRQVRISKPSKNVMQSGTAYMNCWKIEFMASQPRWENWLMGWTSGADPLSNLNMTFPSREEAIAFCENHQLQWFLEEQPERKVRRKSYADNFSWNKRTRTSNK